MQKTILIAAMLFSSNAMAADESKIEYKITIKDHKFLPANLEVPAGQKIKLIVENQDTTPEEFESYDLHREKIVQGNSKITVFVGPLDKGTYKYFGEFNPKTAQGSLTAK